MSNTEEEPEPNTFEDLVEKYEREYEWNYLKKLPENCEWKLRKGIDSDKFNNLPPDALEDLPEINLRTREQVIAWLRRYMNFDSLNYVGW